MNMSQLTSYSGPNNRFEWSLHIYNIQVHNAIKLIDDGYKN